MHCGSLVIILAAAFLTASSLIAEGGSAVASGPYGAHVIVAGRDYYKKAAEQKALALWHSHWRGKAKILASSDVVGDGAVAVWSKGKAWAIGASLGKRSPTEADAIAIKYCLQHCPKGAKPKILRGFRG
jgi:hypothetical protein